MKSPGLIRLDSDISLTVEQKNPNLLLCRNLWPYGRGVCVGERDRERERMSERMRKLNTRNTEVSEQDHSSQVFPLVKIQRSSFVTWPVLTREMMTLMEMSR